MKWVAQRRAARCRSDGIADLPIPADAELKPVVKRPCPDLLLLASLVLVDLAIFIALVEADQHHCH